MDQASISRIEEWDSRPVSGGYAGLNELANADFTGAVTAGRTRLVMLNGRVVGVFDGSISDFEGAEATAYEAPDPSLPLLFAMWERDGEVRGQYYTDDTPIREVDGTLSSGGFTGYLELSENVLSGDYYLVYYGGRSLALAFVGNTRRVVTGDEALELAADEVGIYEVRSVDLEVTDVPEPAGDAAAVADEGGDGADVETAAATAAATEGGDDGAPDDEEPDAGTEFDTSAEPAGDADAGEDVDTEETGPDGEVDAAPPIAEAEPTTESAGATSGDPPDGAAGATSGDGGGSTGRTVPRTEESPTGRSPPSGGEPDERFEEEARWREARTVPALDPDDSERPAADRRQESGEAPAGGETEAPREPSQPDAEVEALHERLRRLEAELESSERERRQLTERLEEALDERDDVVDDRAALEARIDELEARLQEAGSTGASGPSGAGASTGGGARGLRAVDPETALDQTDLFVRYGSKGKATLQSAHDGRAGQEEVEGNLRIETHSRFDTDTATVGGEPFDDHLEATIQYRFVAWLVEELLYEIQETGSESGLKALYDVLPKVDRAEFNGEVTGVDGDGEDTRDSFDVVCRDRMGKPLVVANINDSLDPATGDMMVRLVEDGTAAAEAHDSIEAAFFVTASFFEPDALETVADATRGGGLLSRDSKKSFVKLARNGGYHLCLVEARGDDFHVAVPEF